MLAGTAGAALASQQQGVRSSCMALKRALCMCATACAGALYGALRMAFLHFHVETTS